MAALYGEILVLRNEAARLAGGVAQARADQRMQRNPVIKLNQHFVDSHSLSKPLLYKALERGLLKAISVRSGEAASRDSSVALGG